MIGRIRLADTDTDTDTDTAAAVFDLADAVHIVWMTAVVMSFCRQVVTLLRRATACYRQRSFF
ncbi:hypothetical protein [Paraburkholderia hayleyella]|uniref:hypothetical protein n=1 Tax=Paraburkholderia hayleyella TaxID=2152889 RepID=UPI0012928010|nr:hypothetical protein [Paraburkholderia hayleyella]